VGVEERVLRCEGWAGESGVVRVGVSGKGEGGVPENLQAH
jgi:hypothetical protein